MIPPVQYILWEDWWSSDCCGSVAEYWRWAAQAKGCSTTCMWSTYRGLWRDWWLSRCRGSVVEHWWLKPEVVWLLAAATGLFTFLYFGLITSKYLYTPYSSTPCFVCGLMTKHLLPSATVCTLVCAKLNSILPCYKTSLDRHKRECVSQRNVCVNITD